MQADLPGPVYDLIPVWILTAGMIIIFVLASEIGFQLARRHKRDPAPEERSHAGVLLTALLALLGLLLAFSFSIVGARFLERKQLVVDEANAIGTAYLLAEMLPPSNRDSVQSLLRRYAADRIQLADPHQVAEALHRSDALHPALWTEAKRVAAQQPESPIIAMFVGSLDDVMDLQEKRVAVAIYHRLSPAILATLGAVALLTMGLLGYSAGFARSRTLLPTIAVVTSIAIVISLIIELDRPWQRLVTVSRRALTDVQETMDKRY